MKLHVATILALLVLASAAYATNININAIQSNMQVITNSQLDAKLDIQSNMRLITNSQLDAKLDQKSNEKTTLDSNYDKTEKKDLLKDEVNHNLEILTKSGADQVESIPSDFDLNKITLGLSDTSTQVNDVGNLKNIPELGSNGVLTKSIEGTLGLITTTKTNNNADWTIVQGTPVQGTPNHNLDVLTKSGADQVESIPSNFDPNKITLGLSDIAIQVNNGGNLEGIPDLGSNEVLTKRLDYQHKD